MNNAGAIRDDLGGKVYIVPYGETQEQLLYDYTAQPGDTLTGLYSTTWGIHTQVVVTVDTVNINGIDRRRMGVSHPDFGVTVASNYWIQGIGSLTGPTQTCNCPSVSGATALSCMSENGVVQYGLAVGGSYDCLIHLGLDGSPGERQELSLYPNPSTGRSSLTGTGPLLEVQVLDTQGREVLRTRDRMIDLVGNPPGLYMVVVITGTSRQVLRALLVAP
jgi:hypothetical protein